MPFWLKVAFNFLVNFLARIVADARRDAELKAAGKAEERGVTNAGAAEDERRAAKVPDASVDETIDALKKGEF